MNNTTRPEHLFLVRVWREPSAVEAPGQWRGYVEHVTSGQRLYFTSLDEMNHFITAQTNAFRAGPQLDNSHEVNFNK